MWHPALVVTVGGIMMNTSSLTSPQAMRRRLRQRPQAMRKFNVRFD
jgi:hypothetical protein